MKYSLLLSVLLFTACGGKLSDEQKRRIKESMEEGQIKRVTDAEITEAAFNYGRNMIKMIENQSPGFSNIKLIDSIAAAYGVKIVTLQNGDSTLIKIEAQLIEAYTSANGAQLSDDVQRLGDDSLLYTKPLMHELPDGSSEFVKAIGIHMPRKKVIQSIAKK